MSAKKSTALWIMALIGSLAAIAYAEVTLEFAAVSSGGTVLADGSILVVGQPTIGLSQGEGLTLDAGIVPCLGALVGDMNCDGQVDFGDINPFVLYLSNFASWQAAYADCPADVGDINQDGTYGQWSFGDINPFVALLTGS